MNYTKAKVRLSRRLGIAITPKAARIMEKRPDPPGQKNSAHAFRRRESDYSKQLREKQRLQAQYNLTAKKLSNYVERATRSKGITGEVLIQILETRLDAFVLRAGFARTIYAARQYVTHGHFVIDGQNVNLPGYEIQPGQVVAVRERSRRLAMFQESLEAAHPPGYIQLEAGAMQAQLLRPPARRDVPVICEERLVIEFYSR